MGDLPKKVAILLSSLKFGGGERVSLNLAAEMKKRGISVDILVMSKEGEFLAEAEKDFNVYDLRCNKTYKLPAKLLQYVFLNRPTVVISSFWKLNLCACMARLVFPFSKLILWEHSTPSKTPFFPVWAYTLTASLFYPLATKIVAVSDGVREDIRQCTFGLSRRLITIYNPIVPPDKLLISNSLSRRKKPPQIISVGRLEREKNPELLIRSFAIVSKKSNSNLLLVGDGSLREKLEQLCIELNIESRVIFYGFTKHPYELMVASDLFVLSSDLEGLSNAIIEALYCGLPIVSTDSCGPREVLLEGKYGSLVPINNQIALTEAIENELQNRRLPEIQKSGAQRFLPNLIANQFLDLMI